MPKLAFACHCFVGVSEDGQRHITVYRMGFCDVKLLAIRVLNSGASSSALLSGTAVCLIVPP